MSYAAQAWARKVKTGSPTRKAVLLAIANYADQEFKAWPSQKRLAFDTEFSEKAVRNALADLEEMGIIDRQGRRGGTQSYMSDMIYLCVHNKDVIQPDFQGEESSGTSFRWDDESQRHLRPSQRHLRPKPAAPPSKAIGTTCRLTGQ